MVHDGAAAEGGELFGPAETGAPAGSHDDRPRRSAHRPTVWLTTCGAAFGRLPRGAFDYVAVGCCSVTAGWARWANTTRPTAVGTTAVTPTDTASSPPH